MDMHRYKLGYIAGQKMQTERWNSPAWQKWVTLNCRISADFAYGFAKATIIGE